MREEEIRKGMYVHLLQNGRTARIDQIIRRGRNYMFEIEYLPHGSDGYERVRSGDFEVLPAECVKAGKFRLFVRGEIGVKDLVPADNVPENIVLETAYHLSLKDLLSGLEHLRDKENAVYDDFCSWFEILKVHREEIGFGREGERSAFFDDDEMMQYVYTVLMWDYYDNSGRRQRTMPADFLQEPLDTMTWYLEDKNRALEERRFTEDRMWHIVNAFSDRELEQKPLDMRRLVRLCLDRLCDKNDLNALEKKGYLLFSGSKMYPADWELCRQIFVKYYEETGESSAANTLGDIAMRGLCSAGIGDYETAFRYFSIGHASGCRESTYRLGDLFKDGLGVKKNTETAYLLYRNVYEEYRKWFVSGDHTCRFAEAAMRMGDCYRNGVFVQENAQIAYRYYLEAGLAVRLRIKEADYTGDEELEAAIRKAGRETRRSYPVYATRNIHENPYFLSGLTHGYRRARLTWKKKRNGALRMCAEPLPLPEEQDVPMILWAIEAADYCGLVDHLVFNTAPKTVLQVPDHAEEIIFNHIEYDWEINCVDFYQDELHTGRIQTDGFSVDAPEKRE